MDGLTTADGRRLAYRRTGQGPTLVCHGGGPGFSALYLADLGGLDEELELVLLDPRGTGGSDRPADPRAYAIADYAADLEELREHLGLERMRLLGHSHGGVVAMDYAATHPERVERLILASTLPRWAPSRRPRWRRRSRRARTSRGTRTRRRRSRPSRPGGFASDEELGELALREFPFYFARYGDDERAYLEPLRGDIPNADALLALQPARSSRRSTCARSSRRSRRRRSSITGEEDFITGPLCAPRSPPGSLDAETVLLPGAGHFIFVEAPEAFRDAVLSFLGVVDAIEAVAAIEAGRPVVLPTDTVYGLVRRSGERGGRAASSTGSRAGGRGQPTALARARRRRAARARAGAARAVERQLRALLPGPFTLVVPNPARRFRWLDRRSPGHDRRPRARARRAGAEVLDAVGAVAGDEREPPRRRRPAPARRGPRGDPRRVRRARRRRRAPGHALDRARPDRPRAARPPRGRRSGGRGARARRCAATSADRASSIQIRWRSRRRPFEHLRTAGLAEVDPEIAELLGRELERQRGQIELIASENFTWPCDARGGRLGADEQVRRGLPGQALLRRLRGRRRDRADSRSTARRSCSAPSTRTSSRTRARRRTWPSTSAALEPGDTILVARARPRRPPDARAQGQLLRAALHDRPLRRLARDEHRRLRRGARAREGAPAEADRLRRLRLPAHGRGRPLPRDRRRGRRAAALRHGALRRARRRRAAPEPGAALRLRHLDDAQDARRARAPASSSAARSTRRRSTAPSSRACRAGRSMHTIAAKATCFQIAGDRGVPRLPAAGPRERRRARRRRCRRAGSTCSPAAPTRTCSSSTCARTEWTGKDAEERLARGRSSP